MLPIVLPRRRWPWRDVAAESGDDAAKVFWLRRDVSTESCQRCNLYMQVKQVNAWGDHARVNFLSLHVFIMDKSSENSLHE
jgi:hypothetical protein